MSINVISGRLELAERTIIYGQEGIGKSTLAAGFPRPLFLDTEEGTHHLAVDRVPITCLADLEYTLAELTEGAAKRELQWQTIVLDTADHLWNLCADAVCQEHNWRGIETLDYGKGYTWAKERFISIIERFTTLWRYGLQIVIICHAKIEPQDLPDLSAKYNKYCIKVNAPAKQAEGAREHLREWATNILFCHLDIAIKRDDKNKGTGKATSAERIIHATTSPLWEAKNRLGLPETLPMTADALAAIWSGANVAPNPEYTPANVAAAATNNAPETPQANPEEWVWTDEDRALLLEYFIGIGELTEGQTLADLRPALQNALKARAKQAVAKAQAWKRKQEGGAE